MAAAGLRRAPTICSHKSDITITELLGEDDDDHAHKNNNNHHHHHDNDHHHYHSTGDDEEEDEMCRSLRPVGMASPCRGGRTLSDIIKEEQKMNAAGTGNTGFRNPANGSLTWKSFKNRIRLRRAGSAWAETVANGKHAAPSLADECFPLVSASVMPATGPLGRSLSGGGSGRRSPRNYNYNNSFNNSSSDGSEGIPMGILKRPEEGGDAPKMSLMALLGEGGGFDDEEEEEDDEDYDDEEEEDDDETTFQVCCVCMVRHKGAAFALCGHNFCRLCSRELGAGRGSCCPVCNGFILEILDVF